MQTAMSLERQPHGLPILCRRFHYHLLHRMFLQPRQQMSQVTRGGSEAPTLKLQFGIPGVRDDHRQHSLMHVDSGQIVWVPVFSLAKTENACQTHTHPHVLSLSADSDAHSSVPPCVPD